MDSATTEAGPQGLGRTEGTDIMGLFSSKNDKSGKSNNDAFFEQRVTEIRDAVRSGDPVKAADLTNHAVSESGFKGPEALGKTATELSSAARRLGWPKKQK